MADSKQTDALRSAEPVGCLTELRSAAGHHNDCAGERSEQGASLSPGSSNAVLGCTALGPQHNQEPELAIEHGFEQKFTGFPDRSQIYCDIPISDGYKRDYVNAGLNGG